MSSYNENLRSSVLLSLQTQELEQKKLQAQKDASMQTLYYAEGATIVANQQLDQAVQTFMSKADVKGQAVNNNNIAVNLLSSATQASSYTSQTVSNTSVCAANVQVATNAIVKLASDIGAIFSIVQAADNKTDIYQLAKQARTLMEQTATDAEEASDVAMGASMLASEVSAATVLDKAKVANSYMGNMLKVASEELTSASQLVSAKNDNLTNVSAAEKKAEGDFKDLSIDYAASKAAYDASNAGLNQNLVVSNLTAGSFAVNFNLLKAAFDGTQKKEPNYPVKEYYVIIVKDSKKSTFSLFNAESQVASGPDDSLKTIGYVPVNDVSKLPLTIEYQLVKIPDGESGTKFKTYSLVDSDGDAIKLGKAYVAFVFAVYYDTYKKALNTYEDYLSAPSAPFTLTNKFAAIDPTKITISNGHVTFPGTEQSENAEYRVMFLPASQQVVSGLLNENSFQEFMRLVNSMDRIAEEFDPSISNAKADIANYNSNIAFLQQQLKENVGAALKKSINAEIEANKTALDEVQKKLVKLNREKNIEIKSVEGKDEKRSLGFLFNLAIAEEVLASNYLIATRLLGGNTYSAPLGDDVTDNFGNLLIPGESYLPVVLTAVNDKPGWEEFTANLSPDYTKATLYTYPDNQKN